MGVVASVFWVVGVRACEMRGGLVDGGEDSGDLFIQITRTFYWSFSIVIIIESSCDEFSEEGPGGITP